MPPFAARDALVATMILTAAADGAMSEPESRVIGAALNTLPALLGFADERFGEISAVVVEALGEEDGLDRVIETLAESLPPNLRETAYALACDVAAADGSVALEEMRMLELLRHSFGLERLIAAGIERGARARFQRPA
ncbi:MAG: 2-dehydro-3-deoxyphosphooctonate aldolase [Rhodobacteraceae bacterium]|nr:MAG: 2-dehydro-3-deoxyphosphooctonate aldolase [Paracoccaceae bacterium]